MKRHIILIASVLKPADDIRMAWKIGRSVAKLVATEVHVAGFASKQKHIEGLTLHPLFEFGRLSFIRAFANFKVLKLAVRLKPSVFLFSTHELLPAALLIKLMCGSRLVYDVRENYYRNILYTEAFPPIIRKPLAGLVRGIEKLSARFIDQFILAEKTYFQEMPFVQSKAVTVENKYMTGQVFEPGKALPVHLHQNTKIRLLYSGTIAITYGILEAIHLATSLHNLDSRYELSIIGYAAQPEVLKQVRETIKGKDFITLTGGDQLVPHARIIGAIRHADIGLLPYHPNPGTDNCIPTKLYEYLAHQLPMLLQKNPLWEELVCRWHAGVTIDFKQVNISSLHAQIIEAVFYTEGAPQNIYWQEEKEKLLEVIENLLNKFKNV